MPDWIVQAIHNKKLTDADFAEIAQKIIINDKKFSEETRELAPTDEDKLRRYNM